MIDNLSEREVEVIQLMSDGYDYNEIAEKLYISRETVTSHKKNILRKLKAKNAAHGVKIALKKKIIS